MVNLIKEKTGCNVTIGQNGWIWIRGSNMDQEIRARKAIEHIAEQVFVDGLTDKMEEWFQKN
jgi:exosome complex component RRP4